MIEVEGKMVPNYDATLVTFEEGDIVTGTVVRGTRTRSWWTSATRARE